jgi:hypothetical protein
MPDNISTPVASGTVLATDQIGTTHYPISKLAFGPLDTATPVTSSAGLPVALVAGSAIQTAVEASTPATQAFAITPSDSTALTTQPRALYVGTGGSIALRARGSSSDVTLTNVANGAIIPLGVSHVRATGTTATGIIGLA